MSMPKKGRLKRFGRVGRKPKRYGPVKKREVSEEAKAFAEQHQKEVGEIQLALNEFLKEKFPQVRAEVVAQATMFYSARVAVMALRMHGGQFVNAAREAYKATARALKVVADGEE
jgi:hypothetical protein